MSLLNPLELPRLAEARTDENFRFRDFLKRRTRLSSEEIDRLLFEIAERVWKMADCTTCGNCCREVSPTLTDAEAGRLASHVGVSQAEFAATHLKPAEAGEEAPWVMRARPCPFLSGNLCSAYAQRPANCRNYPYLDKPDLVFRTISMIGRLSECPVVFEVWEQLKAATGFRRRRR